MKILAILLTLVAVRSFGVPSVEGMLANSYARVLEESR